MATYAVIILMYFAYVALRQDTKHLELVAGLSFTLISAYYSGGLVMEFVSKEAPPFETIKEGLTNSEWKLLVLQGNQDGL